MAASALSTTLTTTSATTPAKMIQIASSSQTPRVILVDQAAVTMADDDSFIDGRNEIVDDEVDDDRHVDEEMRIESTKKQAKPTAATATPTTTQIPNRSIHCQNTSRTPTKNTSSTTTTSDGPISGHCPDHPNSPWRRPQSFSSSTSPSERLSPTRTPAATTATQSPAEESTSSPLSPIPLRLQPARTYDPAFEILRSVAPRSMEAITKSQSADPDYDRGSIYRSTPGEPISQHQIPRRNLSETFEELYAMKQTPKTRLNTAAASTSSSEDTLTTSATTIDTDLHHHHLPTIETSSSSSKISGITDVASMISPTGVTELHHRSGSLPPIYSPSTSMVADDADEADMEAALKQRAAPEFKLHSSLQRLMSDDLVQRVSFYAVIHDINKEASAMAANDNSGYSATPDDADEVHDPIVMAVCGESSAVIENDEKKSDENMYANALIDEEQWLLNVIESRSTDETCDLGNAACPPTFLQAMGELEYENPVATLSGGARTQLWKPSRSWWEAKSGKNPWIEPKYHNKRWRYLWPLIHYHKFLAKCIKKLKRNGVDVKISPSPVSAFLREEVCAVSDHLADVSLFDSEQWMDCLQHFFGWTESTKAAEEKSRKLVSELKLRPIQEPGDIDSPLLRSQIDEQFLRAIIQARTLLNVGGPPSETTKRQAKEPTLRREPIHANTKQISSVSSTSHGRHTAAKSHKSRRGLQVAQVSAQQWHGYPPTGWWQPSWQPHAAYPFPDEQSSVHSALSSDSYSHGYMHSYHPNTAVGFHQHPYYPPMMYPQQQMMPGSQNGTYDGSIYQPMAYSSYPMGCGWTSQTEMNNLPHRSDELPAYPSTPSRHQDNYSADLGNAFETPYKYDPNQTNAASPYWNHLQDHATLAMMGLASPQGTLIAPSTPHQHNAVLGPSPESDAKVAATTAQPLFLRQQYYGYSYGGREGYVPPSPASQFQMTPQSGRTFNYTYGFSPRRPPSHSKTSSARISEENKNISDKSGPVTPEKH